MIPQFTAEAGLTQARARYTAERHQPRCDGVFAPQQRATLPANGDGLEWGGTGTTISCPGCAEHACGFLGLSRCLTCC